MANSRVDWMAMMCSIEAHHVADEALSTPPSTTALQELITEVERRTIERCAEVAKAASLEAERIGNRHELESISRDRMFARAREAGYIVSEIRELPTGNLKLEDLK